MIAASLRRHGLVENDADPGFVSVALAEHLGPNGMVYTVDQSAVALTNLERASKLDRQQTPEHYRLGAPRSATVSI